MNVSLAQHTDQRTALLGITRDELAGMLAELDQPAYRAGQILDWVFNKQARSFEAMTNLPAGLRQALNVRFRLREAQIAARSRATDSTCKLLLRWHDQQTTECVLIPDGKRNTACISTQVGCPVGCVFCASGLGGVMRNLSAAQIVEQVIRVGELCQDGQRVTNVVFMGLGEPLANYDNMVRALRIINGDDGCNIAARRITVSTVGLPQRMRSLADEGLQITLALSLHAPTDELRAQLIPWAARVRIAELVDACRYYFDRTGREVTLEYVLLAGVNDTESCANGLARLTRKMRCNVNLIQYNPVDELPYQRPTGATARSFLDRLRDWGVNAHLRPSRGLDIDGACGQLRRRLESENHPPKAAADAPAKNAASSE